MSCYPSLNPGRWANLLLIATLAGSSLSADHHAPAAGSKPNVLFLFADDQTYAAVREYGLTDIDTPNLDRLVKRGTTFTHAYNMGSWSGAVCVASRTMLMTGRSLYDAGAHDKKLAAEIERGVMWPQLMKEAGYRTYFTGKWHVKADTEKIFDEVRHQRPGMPRTNVNDHNRPHIGQPDTWNAADESLAGFWEGGRHWSAIVADDAIEYLDQAKSHSEPFFMYAAFNAPHDPRQAPQEYLDLYPLDRIEVPATYLPYYPYKEEMAAGEKLRDESLAPFPRTEYAVQVHRREYYALVTHLDAQIGRVLDALEESGQADNTWVFFSADHGLSVGQHGLLGKQNMYEHSLRVPFMVVGPGVPANHRMAAPIYLQDVMPTALALAGAHTPDHVFYNSLLPQITGHDGETNYPAVLGSYLDKQRAVIRDGWKLILYPEAQAVRLYNVALDELEEHDHAGYPGSLDRQRALFADLLELQSELGDALDLREVYPHLR
ncbi:MAG: sulfatase-like hydrolase/transferase [Opitutaceae bacterium]|jgi:arylsulfatase A-like enzyme|nr:sulfatase-like hydrolase/transferase [Opitutaceae bacterium]